MTQKINVQKPITPKDIIVGNDANKRNVSESTKKIVAANQKWQCGLCHRMLDETYEVDHITPLYKGGSNNIDNLMALDPICHRKKTIADRLNLKNNT
jgi:5-methylcytosine-specific restriction endonuclease McrA